MRWKNCIEAVLGLLFPDRCVLCDNPGDLWLGGLCPSCRESFVPIRDPWCMKCGKQLLSKEEAYCGDCRRKDHAYERGISLCVYNEPVRRSIYRLKYRERQRYARFYGRAMAKCLTRQIGGFEADLIVPVPLHENRLKVRGYNQAALIARALGEAVGIPVREDVIRRGKDTKALKLLQPDERREQLKSAFNITSNSVKLNNVLVVDDIYTTGATMNEIARQLKSAGAKKVYFITIASGGM